MRQITQVLLNYFSINKKYENLQEGLLHQMTQQLCICLVILTKCNSWYLKNAMPRIITQSEIKSEKYEKSSSSVPAQCE